MLTSILSLIEGIINGFMDFIWALFGISPILSVPHIKLTKNTNKDLSPKDIMDLLNGKYFVGATSSSNPDGYFTPINPSGTSTTYNFLYEIKTSDGRDIKDLDREELKKWIDENQHKLTGL